MPLTSDSRDQEAMQLENLSLCRLYSDHQLGSHNITTRNTTSNEDSTRVWLDDRNGQEPDQSHADSRVFGLEVEHENNYNVNDNISKEGSVEVTKTSDGISDEKETRKNKGLGIENWRDPIHKSTIQTRRASHQVALKVERQGSSWQRLEQMDSTQQERDNGHNMVDQQISSQLTIELYETQQMDNNPDRCFELRMGGKTDQREPRKGVRTRRVERQQPQEFQSTRSDSSFENTSRILSRIDLIAAYWNTITHRQHSQNVLLYQRQRINYNSSTSRQSPQVSRTIQRDNRSQSYSRLFKHYTRQLIKVIRMQRERNEERSPLEDTQGAWDLELYRCIYDTRKPIMHEVLQYLQRQHCCQAKLIQSIMVQGSSTTALTNFITTENYKEDQTRASSNRSLDCAKMAKLEVVNGVERDCNAEEMLKCKYASLTNGSETQKQRLGAATWIDLPFLVRTKTEKSFSDNCYKLED
ncbi:MAG: hypothetical protein EZS28_006246 [Streblomastix strix]|uniref:Uncharacterized protein n=1 Tax=Streblomastix strix TaxID=222440 RepID=A0A5J4WUG3_9EUKA|nr:MAG: hypothetical protein EZS28_006246 [Streblomastix strix]